MIKPTNIIVAIILSFSVFGMFQIKYRVIEIKKDILEIENQIASERQSIHVLGAEWAYLNKPSRLRELANKYLKLQVISHEQIVNYKGQTISKKKARILPENITLSSDIKRKEKWNFKDKTYHVNTKAVNNDSISYEE